MSDLKNIPCNIVTGFLGSGKTTAILKLLEQKPKDETWAVLVNEFGKIGIDGKVIAASGGFVKEIPGGCMCCSAGVSMQVAINSLLKTSRPQRLLIEPSGIGHPRQIIKQLTQAPLDQVLDIRACITLLDARQLHDERYTSNTLFNEQIELADVLLANKADQCSTQDQQAFINYVNQLKTSKQATAWIEHGQFDIEYLDIKHLNTEQQSAQYKSISNNKHSRHKHDYHSFSWQFGPSIRFSYPMVLEWASQLNTERLKALVITDQGNIFINSINNTLNTVEIKTLDETQIDIISATKLDLATLKKSFENCIIKL